MPGGFLVRVCAVVFALILGCGRAGAAEPITVGFGMALTGGIAANGRAALIAMKLWEEDVNKAGGLLGRPVKLVYYDDQSTPSNVPGLYTKLLDVDHVDIVVSGYGTNMTVPAVPVVMAHNRMFMTLFALAVNADFKYPRFFGMIPTGPSATSRQAYSGGFFEIVKGMNPRPKTLAIIGADAEASRNGIEGALDNAKAAGLEVVYNRSYPPTTNDFSSIVRGLQSAHADVVYIASYPPDSVGLVNAFHEVGLKARLVGGNMVGLQTT
jgi:branched-chain amino acid transport system substrate-binding protein